jgi:hypothetical protein
MDIEPFCTFCFMTIGQGPSLCFATNWLRHFTPRGNYQSEARRTISLQKSADRFWQTKNWHIFLELWTHKGMKNKEPHLGRVLGDNVSVCHPRSGGRQSQIHRSRYGGSTGLCPKSQCLQDSQDEKERQSLEEVQAVIGITLLQMPVNQ